MPSYRENTILTQQMNDLLPLFDDNKTAIIEAGVTLLWQQKFTNGVPDRDDLLERLRSKALSIVAQIEMELQ